uniref:DUF378 domain-containing protein n=1 Tax=viral metagenome TaxID=1070528 RepID=A0A6C0H5F3_9ZZZZ
MKASVAFKVNPIKLLAELLIIIGALNWLWIGLFNRDFVGELVKSNSKYVYILVGISGVYLLIHKIIWISKG